MTQEKKDVLSLYLFSGLAFRIWANSHDINDLSNNPYFFNNLYEDVSDAVQLIKLMEKVGKPGLVDWKKVANPANNKFKVLQNCNYAVEVAKNLGLTVVNIGGSDINNKNKKLILGIFWQMVRKHTLEVIFLSNFIMRRPLEVLMKKNS
jgi:hypothetical protein